MPRLEIVRDLVVQRLVQEYPSWVHAPHQPREWYQSLYREWKDVILPKPNSGAALQAALSYFGKLTVVDASTDPGTGHPLNGRTLLHSPLECRLESIIEFAGIAETTVWA